VELGFFDELIEPYAELAMQFREKFKIVFKSPWRFGRSLYLPTVRPLGF